MVADLTGFKTKYLPLTRSSENLSGLAAPELNSPARKCLVDEAIYGHLLEV